jgi:hypothetical protein
MVYYSHKNNAWLGENNDLWKVNLRWIIITQYIIWYVYFLYKNANFQTKLHQISFPLIKKFFRNNLIDRFKQKQQYSVFQTIESVITHDHKNENIMKWKGCRNNLITTYDTSSKNKTWTCKTFYQIIILHNNRHETLTYVLLLAYTSGPASTTESTAEACKCLREVKKWQNIFTVSSITPCQSLRQSLTISLCFFALNPTDDQYKKKQMFSYTDLLYCYCYDITVNYTWTSL